jgi:hypothetical protein
MGGKKQKLRGLTWKSAVAYGGPLVEFGAGSGKGNGPHGHLSSAGPPTAAFRQISASVAVIGSDPFGAHTHSTGQATAPTVAFRM